MTWKAPADSQQPIDPIALAQALIRCPSVTPADEGALDTLAQALQPVGFTCRHMPFEAPGTARIDNLYAKLNGKLPGKHFSFAGHSDVVPVGRREGWSVDPFAAEIVDGRLYGRGAADMKGAIAAFAAAAARFAAKTKGDFPGAISLLITGDEEGPSVNGTKPMLQALAADGEQFDACLVGEPTNPKCLGEMAKIGRRGSWTGHLTVKGVQGHIAYPHLADNPLVWNAATFPGALRPLAGLEPREPFRGTGRRRDHRLPRPVRRDPRPASRGAGSGAGVSGLRLLGRAVSGGDSSLAGVGGQHALRPFSRARQHHRWWQPGRDGCASGSTGPRFRDRPDAPRPRLACRLAPLGSRRSGERQRTGGRDGAHKGHGPDHHGNHKPQRGFVRRPIDGQRKYTKHKTDDLTRWRVSEPGDPTRWGPERTFDWSELTGGAGRDDDAHACRPVPREPG